MPQLRLSAQEACRRGEEIYRRKIRPIVIDDHRGEFLSLDIETGDYEVGTDEVAALQRLRDRCPEGQFYTVRVGYTTAHAMGGTLKSDES